MLILFQQISIVSPLANAVAIPVVTFIVVPLALASIVVPWDLLLVAAHEDLRVGRGFLEIAERAAIGSLAAARAAGVGGDRGCRRCRCGCSRRAALPGVLLGVVWLVPLFVVVPLLPAPGAFRVTVLDVGQGLAVLVQTHQHALLYDTGPRYQRDAPTPATASSRRCCAAIGVRAPRRADRESPGQRSQRRSPVAPCRPSR